MERMRCIIGFVESIADVTGLLAEVNFIRIQIEENQRKILKNVEVHKQQRFNEILNKILN